MSNYSKATNFTAKDNLITGNPSKLIKGSEIDAELNAIAAAIASKGDSADYMPLSGGTFTGTVSGVTPTAGDSSAKLCTTAFASALSFAAALPGQTGNSGKFITTDGSSASWTDSLKTSILRLVDGTDITKKLAFDVSGVTTGTTRTLTVPNYSGMLGLRAKGADVASAATIDLDSATGDFVHITGTTTITAITLSSGVERTVVFDGALTLTHNATTLILPGGANITTAAGDRATFRGDGTGNVRCVHYTKADGTAITGGATVGNLVQLSRAVPSGQPVVDFTSLINSTYDEYIVDLLNVYPTTDSVELLFRTSTDNGSTFDTSYNYASARVSSGASTVSGGFGSSASSIALSGGGSVRNTAQYGGISLRLRIVRPSATQMCQVSWQGGYANTSGGIITVFGFGERASAADVDAIRFFFSSGTVSSGTIILYGVKK
jgi:hypothetical protein